MWDGSGEPDPEIQRLETVLVEFRHDRPTPVFPEIVPDRRWALTPWRMRLFPARVTAISAVLVVAGITFLVGRRKPIPVSVAGWDVFGTAGTPRMGRKTISGQEGSSRLGIGQVLETDEQSRARLQAEGIGQIDMEPRTRLRLLTMGTGLKRIALDRRTIHTFIWAPPGQFVVDTPSAVTVD